MLVYHVGARAQGNRFKLLNQSLQLYTGSPCILFCALVKVNEVTAVCKDN